MRRKWKKLLLPAAAMLLLTGCLFRPPDDLYKLPEKSPGYEQLNSAIRTVRSDLEMKYGTSCELAVIVGGENTASIQLLPATIASVRAAAGCETPFDILPAVWMSSALSVAAGLAAARLFSALGRRRA